MLSLAGGISCIISYTVNLAHCTLPSVDLKHLSNQTFLTFSRGVRLTPGPGSQELRQANISN